ncbi:endonuclease III [Deltaproteobacteria bacterium]|nr:endonuclease III [Deltaproteobacteria bacterium]
MISTYAKRRKVLEAMYVALSAHFGPSNWWPAKTPFEVALGAILTQNTAWGNVEKALRTLDEETNLVPDRIKTLPLSALEKCIYPAGFFRQKSRTIHYFLHLMEEHGGLGGEEKDMALRCFAGIAAELLREKLLAVSGIGPETADSILLYALDRPSFVVDAYTKRLFHRHGLVTENEDYAALREFFMDALPHEAALFNEYHALIVRVGKDFCRKTKSLCDACPLQSFLEHSPE